MTRLAHVIFDLDGTLTDPREGITRSLAHALSALGRPVPPLPALEKYIGPPTREVMSDLLQTADPARIELAVSIYRERFARVGLFENAPYAGVHAVLRELRGEGYLLWMCTSKPRVYAQRIAEHFALHEHLNAVYGCELDGTRADKAELLGYLLESEGIAPAQALMIGDREHDVRAARLNQVRSLGVLYGFGSERELREAGADALCSTLGELPDAIAKLAAA